MKKDTLVIKHNLLPWYNELDDTLDIDGPGFPSSYRERILAFGEYTLIMISIKETHLKKVEEEQIDAL
ncbi:hypothetical protein ACFQZT_22960 [Paenibacillus sp. GCM10027628]|uniref:hypothetical protein n=1 Tax=Paenibacillus sp. GCM10027628 TaxID=3273413 RepID=UPI00364450A1